MRTIVKTFLLGKVIFLLIILSINVVKAQNSLYFNQFKPVFGRVVNSEISVATTFTANAKIYIGDTVTIDSLSYSLPTGFTLSSTTNIIGSHYPSDSLTFSISIQNNDYSNLSFYPCEFTCKVNYTLCPSGFAIPKA